MSKRAFINDQMAAWEVVFQIIEGFNAHHKEYKPKNFANNNGKTSSNDKDNKDSKDLLPRSHQQKSINQSICIR